jgi:glycosyltransferase involved in cell wall biosynthesis
MTVTSIPKMRIYLDNIIFNLQEAGGISVYWSEIIKRLLKDNKGAQFIESSICSNIFRQALDIGQDNILAESSLPIRILRYLPLQNSIAEFSIFHSSYYRICNQANVFNITTVHDFTYEFYRKGLAKYVHTNQKKLAIKKANGIICVSENTKRDLLRFNASIDDRKVTVIYNGVSDDFYPMNKTYPEIIRENVKSVLDKRYILYIGAREYYKKFDIAVNVISELKDYFLVIVGGKDLTKDERRYLEKKLGGRYFHFKGLGNKDLNALYNYAFCLLYPSLYEGFGIPIIEAMKAGCPVVTTNVSSIPEVCGDAGLMVEEVNIENIICYVRKLEEDNFREHIIQLGFNQARKFSWDKCYRETMQFYEKVYRLR